MGFRNPVTSASALDTRAGDGTAGTRSFTRPIPGRSDGAVQGVVEFDDGVVGDVPAVLTSQPGTARTQTGGITSLQGGSYGGTAAPVLDLEVVPAGDAMLGGAPLPAAAAFGRVARITGADLLLIDAGTQVQADGVPVVCSSRAARDALTKAAGLAVVRTDLGALVQRWDGNGWRFFLSGHYGANTDANGLLVFGHGGDGQAPTAWGCTARGQVTDALNEVVNLLAFASDATNLTARATRTDQTAYLSTNPVNLYWWAQF